MKEHIFAVMNHYKGKVYCYDVVNEAIDDGRGFLRNSQWLRVAGEHFIDSAFVYAHQADPDALLFYNDYGLNNPAKREKCYQLVKGMLERGIPIHGIGMQGHYNVNMDYNTVDESLTRFEELGVLIQFTESSRVSRTRWLDLEVTPVTEAWQPPSLPKSRKPVRTHS